MSDAGAMLGRMSCEAFALILSGGIVQGLGFGLALYQSLSTRRKLIPDSPSVFVRGARWVGRTAVRVWRGTLALGRRALTRLGFKRTHQDHASVNATVSGGGSLTAEAYARRGVTVEDRLASIEGELPKIHRSIADARTEAERGIDSAIEGVRAERRAELRRSLALEELGVFAFLIGLGLTTWGALV